MIQALEQNEQIDLAQTIKEIEAMVADYALADNGWLEAAYKYDPALHKYGSADRLREVIAESPEKAEVLHYPGLKVMAAHQKANELYNEAIKLVAENQDSVDGLSKYANARRYSEAAKVMSGADIHGGAQIAPNLFIDHNTGVVIGETAIIGKPPKITQDEDGKEIKTYGNPCFLLHGVTLGGSKYKVEDDRVDGGLRRHPELGDGVVIGSNANVYGACYIGDNVCINTGATIIDGSFADCQITDNPKADEELRTTVGANAEVTNSTIGKNVKLYANAIVFKSPIADNARIFDGAKISKSNIGDGAIINSDAIVSNCVIGAKAIIDAGVRLDGVVVPAGARVLAPETPKYIICSPEHEGVVTTRMIEVEGKASKKPDKVSVFAEIENTENWQDKLAAYAAQKANELGEAIFRS